MNDDNDFIGNDFGKTPSNGITTKNIIIISILIIILTCIIGFIFYYIYKYYYDKYYLNLDTYTTIPPYNINSDMNF